MKMESIHVDKETLIFTADIEDWYANLLRRCILREVPTLAIEDIEFKKNDSSLYDEIIAHRLGLMPLTTPLRDYNFKETCACKGAGCSHCTVKLTLKEKGPKMVYAKHMKSADPKVNPVFEDTPIVKLGKEQKIEFEAVAVLGNGKEHAKWSPGHCFYKYAPEIKITGVKNPEEIVKACPKNIFKIEGNKLIIVEKKIIDCHLCNACVEAGKGTVAINEDKDKIIFYLESFGQMKCKDILLNAIQTFEDKLDELQKLVKT